MLTAKVIITHEDEHERRGRIEFPDNPNNEDVFIPMEYPWQIKWMKPISKEDQ